jgi:ribosomal protein S12 methylthiotransferase accessory factor
MPYFCTEHSGFWQRRFAEPASCPVCEDYRHPLPPDGYVFLTPEEVDARVEVRWTEVLEDVWMFWTAPQIGIGSRGFLVVRPEGNVAFEGATWYDDAALEQIEALGGVRYLSSSHPHVYGALWRLAERFAPETVLHAADLDFAQAVSVDWPFADRATLAPGVTLHHTGAHTPGHTVMHLEDRQILFCGDALKFELDTYPAGHATTISCHKAFDAHIPLTHAGVRRYRAVMEPLAFDAVVTPWEVVTEGGKVAALRLFEAQLAGRPFADRLPVDPSWQVPEAPPRTSSHDADPAPVQRYREAVPDGTIHAFPITDLDRVGVPIWTVAHWPGDGSFTTAVGYGPTERAARIGAWGELAEKAFAHDALAGEAPREAPYAELAAAGEDVLDPRALRLPAGTDYDHDQPLLWTQARRYPSGDPVWIPVEEAAAYFSDLAPFTPPRGDWLYTPITNGLGAGDTFERALAHGLLELHQRDGNSVQYRAFDRHVGVALDSVADPTIRRLLRRFDDAGIDVVAKLADTSFGMANLYVVGRERDLGDVTFPLMITGCGEGVHPDREVALGKALREFASSRARKRFNLGPLDPMTHLFPDGYLEAVRRLDVPPEEDRAMEAMREWLGLSTEALLDRIETTLRVEETVAFSSLPTVAPGTLTDPPDVLARVSGQLDAAGFDVLYLDYTPAGGAAHAVKAIVPGLEVETATYHRIGPRNLRRLLAAGSDLVGLGDPPDGAARVPLTEEAEAELGGPAWMDVEGMKARVDGLYAMYREPRRHRLALADEQVEA